MKKILIGRLEARVQHDLAGRSGPFFWLQGVPYRPPDEMIQGNDAVLILEVRIVLHLAGSDPVVHEELAAVARPAGCRIKNAGL